MNKRKKSYTIFQKITSVFLMLVLVWLTVSTPFVASMQQELAKQQKALMEQSSTDCEDGCNDGNTANNVEEKVPSSINLAEEFLHDHHITHHFFSIAFLYHKLENAGDYVAYHGELHVPPPNAA